MSKYTTAKRDRMLESVPVISKSTNKIIGRITIRKAKTDEPTNRKTGTCERCGGEILVAPGQIQRFHRECRFDAREARRIGRHRRSKISK